MSQQIAIITGSHNFDKVSAKVYCFLHSHVNRPQKDLLGKCIDKVGKVTFVPASQKKEEGMWYLSDHKVDNGLVLSVEASVTMNRSPYASATLLLYTRADADLIALDVNVFGLSHATYQKVRAFVGRADVLSINDLKDLNVVLNPYHVKNNFNKDELEELFTVNTLQKGKPTTMATIEIQGKKKQVRIPAEPRRRIKLRKY